MTKSNNCLVSVIIPVFNTGLIVSESINSVLRQTYKNFEVIIVDDGSTDRETLETLNKFNNNPMITILKQLNSGPSVARNLGIEKSRGELVVCLDSDDLIAKNYLEKLVRVFNISSEEVAIVTTYLQSFGKSKEQWVFPLYNQQTVDDFKYTNLLHGASMFRKSIWQEVGGYDATFRPGFEDWDFWLSIIKKGYSWQIVPEAIFYYRRHQSSLITKTNQKRRQLSQLLYKKHADLYGDETEDTVLQKMYLAEQRRHQSISVFQKIKHIFSRNFLRRFELFR